MPAPTSSRTLWKGAISFGLVHIPITLHSATEENRMRFNLLDKKSMNPIGNKQVNKVSGKEMKREDIVKGYEYEKDQFVVVTPDEIKAALPRTTQTIEIESFVDGNQIPTAYYNKPYFVAPAAKGQKPYKLLVETMKRTGKVGIARVVISTRQHLAALIADDHGLVLELLRWEDEVRDTAGLPLPDSDTTITEKELKMAEQLVKELVDKWKPASYHDEFRNKLEQVIAAKVKAGEGEAIVKPIEGEEMTASTDILDLTELLKRSLRKGGKATDEPEEEPAAKSPAEPKAKVAPPHRKAANDEPVEAPPRKAAAAKKTPTSTTTVKPKPRKKAA
ncbi:MAG: Ku protein [Ramlibacter sp.]|nr:Ku protein [Ramlibacter sp.]